MMKNFYKSIFFSRRFYWVMVAVIILFIFSFGIPLLFTAAQLALLTFVVAVILDYTICFTNRNPVNAQRLLPEHFSNGDQNKVQLIVKNNFPFAIKARIIDELPAQLQVRDFSLYDKLLPNETKTHDYIIRPIERGEYVFHNINFFFKSPVGLVVRRKIIPAEKMVKTLPSYLSLRKYELLAHSNNLAEGGIKKIRKLGHSLEFEQIKEYVTGDDIRSVNWKATGRKGGQLMVNQYTDEKSQQVYCIIDQGRVMKMPFEEMTLLDYAINATLILSRVALFRQDKAGLVIFSDQVSSFLPADHKSSQMPAILDMLYNQQTKFPETDYEKLHALIRTRITQRSLVVLFTNFESLSALQRQLPYIRSIARNHLLLVVFFENTELANFTSSSVKTVEDLYIKTIAGKFAYEKRLIVKELQQHGIPTILTSPGNLTVNVVNKYLEIKARQAI